MADEDGGNEFATTAVLLLTEAQDKAYTGSAEHFPITAALVGIGWAVLAVADAIDRAP